MRLLLTSAGFTNEKIVQALKNLADKPFNELNLAFIPTAANVEEGDKWWLLDDFENCKKLGFKSFDIVDISALPKDIWQKRLEAADILLFGGGNTFHLMYWIEKSGLKELLPELLKTRVYVGISAGSMVTGKNFSLSSAARLYSESIGKVESDEGLGFVDFQIRPHFNSPDFPNVRVENLEKQAKDTTDVIYAIDDQTAIKVEDGNVEVVSTGEWKKFN